MGGDPPLCSWAWPSGQDRWTGEVLYSNCLAAATHVVAGEFNEVRLCLAHLGAYIERQRQVGVMGSFRAP